jgi:hypothetical protein
MENWPIVRFVAKAPYSKEGYAPGSTIKVTAGLHKLDGNARPYWSVTADIRERGREVAGGCLHDDVLAVWPELAPVVALHLSDDTGEPMHAEANGWYWLAGHYGGAGERYHGGNAEYNKRAPIEIFADSVRISVDEAWTLANIWQESASFGAAIVNYDWKKVREAFGAWVEAQRPRWQAESDQAVALLASLNAKQEAEK